MTPKDVLWEAYHASAASTVEELIDFQVAALRDAGYRIVRQTNITMAREDNVPLRRVWIDDLEDAS